MKEISKTERILSLYDALMAGEAVHRETWAAEHGVCERSVRRDLDDIRQHLGARNDRSRQKTYILYSRKDGCHRAAHLEACELTAEEFQRLAGALEKTALPGEDRRRILRKIFFSSLTEDTRRALYDAAEAWLGEETEDGQ